MFLLLLLLLLFSSDVSEAQVQHCSDFMLLTREKQNCFTSWAAFFHTKTSFVHSILSFSFCLFFSILFVCADLLMHKDLSCGETGEKSHKVLVSHRNFPRGQTKGRP